MIKARRPLMLIILDGWGYREDEDGNDILAAITPNLNILMKGYPWCFLEASGEAVGLPEGQMGNSEVGHLNIGAGRIVYQNLTRINLAIKNGDFFKNPVFLNAISNVKVNDSSLRLMGLVSYGGVHSYMTHIFALIKLANENKLKKIYIHVFLDGRDVPPKTALGDIKELDAFCRENGNAQIATVSGRYYAMDRDNRWDRIKLAFEAITKGVATYTAPDAETAVSEAYGRGETDEFVKSTIIIDSEGNPETIIKDNDSVIFFNFRSDRARQLTWAFVKKDFEGASRGKNVRMFTMSVWSNMMKP